MTGGKNEISQKLLARMKAHGIPVPEKRETISIPDSETVLRGCFEYLLSLIDKKFIWQPEYEKIAEWLKDSKGKGLFMYGGCGRGKSFLLRHVIPAILLSYSNKVVCVYDMIDINAKIDEILLKPIVALDDIGTEEVVNIYGNKRLAFAEIMDRAERDNKLIIISSNLDKIQIIEKYGDRTYDRIIATTHRVEFKGKSLRR